MKFETINVRDLNLSEANEIQFLYPSEPDWKAVSDDTLVALIKDYVSEPNCATIALGKLSIRNHPLTKPLAKWLLQEKQADEWLRESAQDTLDDE
ncbi:hypothetical protein QT397_20695 [Microbulbifer sp. MKSA007]|uniref:hypothetical protein n=1 Tax=Microbulbifer sp. PAAF003 TaxID=3243375 RepID=UPI002B2C23D3|nr:hypothetical protein QT397_20695 [Microbulbifer sp. MKSA007]